MKKSEADDLFDEIFAEETKKKAPRPSAKGVAMGPSGANMGPSGANMGPSGANMGPSGANMGPSGADMMRPAKKTSRKK